MPIECHANEKYVTGHCLGSSRGRGWTNVLAERWSHARGELPSVLPRDTELAVLLSDATLVDREGAGLKQRTHGRRGTAWLCPAGIREEYIDFKQPLRDCLHIFLPAQPFAHAVEQDFGVDPARVALRYDVIARDPFIEQVAVQIARELDRQTAAGALLIEGLGQALSAYLVNHCAETAVRLKPPLCERPLDERRKQRVLAFIEAHVAQPFTVAELAAVACMSPAHFARSFKQTFGVAPHAYVSAQRLDLARKLLSGRAHDLAAVATAAGFSNASNFARAFKQATGYTPAEYRELGLEGVQ
ncbi:AraC family transcriptional regulator [Methylobacterium gnaphalii]|uniref:AraC family transcriptional regulator n=1 Tax=Methylobacterium gnaphalii TaxID=1010610 RepID=A0A512JPV9_9HYPH|nr:AraC family transcriptional regulator [Methylobacterium gnaphalii]GEP12000.1 AraC family transcriptional regulator [Methylobacterium gnaphalii]GJD68651.1 HTH-type transcriptional activator RhaR [Methylobacterium gnaphalii]GLS49452.1 AraC family transcriptional regulator [Methylobacterium gnaphalii]